MVVLVLVVRAAAIVTWACMGAFVIALAWAASHTCHASTLEQALPCCFTLLAYALHHNEVWLLLNSNRWGIVVFCRMQLATDVLEHQRGEKRMPPNSRPSSCAFEFCTDPLLTHIYLMSCPCLGNGVLHR